MKPSTTNQYYIEKMIERRILTIEKKEEEKGKKEIKKRRNKRKIKEESETEECTITEEEKMEYDYSKYNTILFRTKYLIKKQHQIINTYYLNKYGNLIIHNLIQYGSDINKWRERKEIKDINDENLEIIVKYLLNKYRKNEVIKKAIFMDKINEIINQIKKGEEINSKFIENYRNGKNGLSIDLVIMEEIIKYGPELYEIYTNNIIIKNYLIENYGKLTKKQEENIIKERINNLYMTLNCLN